MSGDWVSEQTNVYLCDWQGPPQMLDTRPVLGPAPQPELNRACATPREGPEGALVGQA